MSKGHNVWHWNVCINNIDIYLFLMSTTILDRKKSFLYLGNFIAVCKDSYVIYACGFDQLEKWSGYAESMRFNENYSNRMISRHVCHLAVDYWRSKPLWFLCNTWVNLSDLQTILKWFSSESQQISVIHEPLWNGSGVNLGEYHWCAKHFKMILKWISVNLSD